MDAEREGGTPDGAPFRATLWIKPAFRTDFIDVRTKLEAEFGTEFARYPKALYISDHTTAGYLDQRIARRLGNDDARLGEYLRLFHEIFPPSAGYVHDEMALRTELTDEQKAVEPENADSHLAFISAGLQSAASYDHGADPENRQPVWFVDLDGVHRGGVRDRRTTVVGYGAEQVVARETVEVAASRHPVDALDLGEPEVGFLSRLAKLVEKHGISFGRVDVALPAEEKDASLTVNEFEPLLMNRDLRAVLREPLRYMADQGRQVLRRPLALPGKALKLPSAALRLSGEAWRRRDSATLEAAHVLNAALERLGVDETVIARILYRSLRFPVSRFHGLKRGISLPVIDVEGDGAGRIPWGTYQSPIIIQWRAPERPVRRLSVTLVRFV